MPPPWYRWDGSDLILNVRIQPRASRDEIVGLQGAALKIRLTAPPVEGKANEHLTEVLAQLFDVPKSMIHIIKGKSARTKCLRIHAPRKLPSPLQLAPKP